MSDIATDACVEIVFVAETPVGIQMMLDASFAHKRVDERILANKLCVSRAQHDGYRLTITLPEGEHWNSDYERHFKKQLRELFGHDVSFEPANYDF